MKITEVVLDGKRVGIAGGRSIAAGDGLTIADGVASVDTPVRGVLTEEEFNALPEAEQNKGMYVIPDADGGESPGESYENVYSTEEKRIGTWIDGRPLYRKVAQFNGLSTTNYISMAQVPLDSTDRLVNFYGVTWSDSERTKWAGPFPYLAQNFWNSGAWVITIMRMATNTHHIVAQGVNDNAITKNVNFSFDVVLEYTKTTDQPEVTA